MYWVTVSYNVIPVCLAFHCLVACIGCWSDSPCVSHYHLWLSVDFQGIPHRHWSQPPPEAEISASESRSKHDRTHRVCSRRRLVLETTCSDPPTDPQRNRNAHALSCTNFAAIVGAWQLIAMVARGRAWFIVEFGRQTTSQTCIAYAEVRIFCLWPRLWRYRYQCIGWAAESLRNR